MCAASAQGSASRAVGATRGACFPSCQRPAPLRGVVVLVSALDAVPRVAPFVRPRGRGHSLHIACLLCGLEGSEGLSGFSAVRRIRTSSSAGGCVARPERGSFVEDAPSFAHWRWGARHAVCRFFFDQPVLFGCIWSRRLFPSVRAPSELSEVDTVMSSPAFWHRLREVGDLVGTACGCGAPAASATQKLKGRPAASGLPHARPSLASGRRQSQTLRGRVPCRGTLAERSPPLRHAWRCPPPRPACQTCHHHRRHRMSWLQPRDQRCLFHEVALVWRVGQCPAARPVRGCNTHGIFETMPPCAP